MRRDEQNNEPFAEFPSAARLFKGVAIMLFTVGISRQYYFGETKGMIAECCYSGAALLFAKTFERNNPHKQIQLIASLALLSIGLSVDTQSFLFPEAPSPR